LGVSFTPLPPQVTQFQSPVCGIAATPAAVAVPQRVQKG